jgi:peptidoglycan/xylan/chitin deacetylase (PgdA/CDA1 family)
MTNYIIMILSLTIASFIVSQDVYAGDDETKYHNKLSISVDLVPEHYEVNKIDSLLKNDHFHEINKKYATTLGRDSDPKLETDISKTTLLLRKLGWSFITAPGLRLWTKILYPRSTISHFDVEGAVAFTIDDGFCGLDNSEGCMLEEVRKLLNAYDAHATFFIAGTHCQNNSIYEVNSLIEDGNEIANHNMMDWKYDKYSVEDFEFDLLLSKNLLTNYNQKYSKWYRAPFGTLSDNIEDVIDKHGMIHVLPDAFAHDTYIPDPNWIAKHILKKVKPGSIILIHMPEKGVREWNYEAIELTLKGLQAKKLKVLNLSEIDALKSK